MATGNIDKTSDETFTYICSACAEDGKNVEATKFCVECQGYCCQPCVDLHKTVPVLKKHTVLDNSHFQSAGAGTNLPAIPTERCSKHKLKIVDMYCDNDDVVGCATCMALDHRSCQKVYSVTDSIQTLWRKSDIEDLAKTLEKRGAELSDVIKNTTSLLERFETSRDDAAGSIECYGKQIRSLVKILEQKTLASLETKFQIYNSKIVEGKKAMEECKTLINKYSFELKQSTGNKAQQFVYSKIAAKAIEEMNYQDMAPADDFVQFKSNNTIESFLKTLESLGEVELFLAVSSKPKPTAYRVKSRRDLYVKTSTDKEVCDIESMCLRDDGSLLLVDSKNKKLKFTDSACMSVDDCCNLQKSPHDVCYIINEEAVVTYEDTFVDIVPIGNPRKSMKRINLPYTCFGIICDNSKFITTDYSHNVHIYDLDFNHKTTVSEDIHGSLTFSESRRIAVSDNGDRLFVTDSENGVVILENNGSYIKTIKERRLSGEDGICTDRRGNIFLCGYHSNNVVQISEEGESFGVILRKADGIENPQSVCFNPSNNTLFISLLNNDVVKVFELK